jgi:hypothetical protein
MHFAVHVGEKIGPEKNAIQSRFCDLALGHWPEKKDTLYAVSSVDDRDDITV